MPASEWQYYSNAFIVLLIEFLFPLDSDFLVLQTVLVHVIFCTFPSTEQCVTLNILFLNKKCNHLFFFSVWCIHVGPYFYMVLRPESPDPTHSHECVAMFSHQCVCRSQSKMVVLSPFFLLKFP